MIAAPVAADPLFIDRFDDTVENIGTPEEPIWRPNGAVWNHRHVGAADILGEGDWLIAGGDGASGANGFTTLQTFPRGENLRCTYTIWHQERIDSGEGAESSFGCLGPWRQDTDLSEMWNRVEAGFDWVTPGVGSGLSLDLSMGLGFYEHGFFNLPEIGNTTQAGVRLEQAFQDAMLASLDVKTSAVTIRVWLGNESGAFGEWTVDGGLNWNPLRSEQTGVIVDTRGLPPLMVIDPPFGLKCRFPAADMLASNNVPGGQQDVHVGFAVGFGQFLIDDVIVENDSNTLGGEPVNTARHWTFY